MGPNDVGMAPNVASYQIILARMRKKEVGELISCRHSQRGLQC